MSLESTNRNNSEILFFILVFLLLFYDSRPIGILARRFQNGSCAGNSELLFFILVFLLLFY